MVSLRLTTQLNELDRFVGATWRGKTIVENEIRDRTLGVIVPKGSITTSQRAVLEAAEARAKQLGLGFKIFER
jgi:hypothetical protein